MRIHIKGGRLVDPANGIDAPHDLFIADGKIAGIGQFDGFQPDQTIDAAGCIVSPGLIELAAHLREPGQTHKASIGSESRAAVKRGITTLCCPPDTSPVVDNPSVVEMIQVRAAEADAAKVVPIGALTQGLEGQYLANMASLKQEGCPAVADGGRPVANSVVLRRAMEYAATHGLPIILTPADPWLAGAGVMHEGGIATRMGIPGIPVAAETAALGRDIALVRELGVPVHFARLSSRAGVHVLRQAMEEGLPVSADVAIHQLFLSEQDVWGFDGRCHVQPPLRTDADRLALREAVKAGHIGIVCADHQPHDNDAKAKPLEATEPGISGLDSLLGLLLRMVENGDLTLDQALKSVTAAPADLLGLPSGRLNTGAPADVCVFDPEDRFFLNRDSMLSRGKNSPFTGWEFGGVVKATLVDGRIAFSV